MSRLKEKYNNVVIGQMMETFKYKNRLQVPKLTKIVVNCTSKDAVVSGKAVDMMVETLAQITGQRPVVTRSKNSISGFKIREKQALGAMVTLRGNRMYEFLDRLVSIALPRVRDFRGLSPKGLDGRGNYTLGLKEQIIFPEIEYDQIDKVRGLNVAIVTTAESDEEGKKLLEFMGVPFRK
jgi:large subunit ribosomal protein L5